MIILRRLFQSFVLLLFLAVGMVSAWAFPTDNWSTLHYSSVGQHQSIHSAGFSFTARDPPPIGGDVTITGTYVHGNGDVRTLDDARVQWVSLNFSADLDAPNRTAANADDLANIRTRYGISDANTVAAGRSDIPGLEGQTFEGLSPALRREAGLDSLDDLYGANRPIRSPNPNPIASRHAEEDILNGFARQIDDAGLSAAQLNGRTVNIHISNSGGVCNTCYQGLGSSSATPGVIRQFSERYPNLNIRITAEGGTVRPGVDAITVRGGRLVE